MKKIKWWGWVLITFFILWTIRELFVSRFIPLGEPISAMLFKVVLWIGLPVVYLQFRDKKNPIEYLRLDSFPKKAIYWSVGIGLIYVFAAILYNGPRFEFSANVDDWLNGFLLVGLTEEIFFRGFVMRKFEEKFVFWKANFFQAILFVLIHVPFWIAIRDYSTPTAVPFVMIFGLAMGYITMKTKSLWPAIIFHSLADFAVIVLIYR